MRENPAVGCCEPLVPVRGRIDSHSGPPSYQADRSVAPFFRRIGRLNVPFFPLLCDETSGNNVPPASFLERLNSAMFAVFEGLIIVSLVAACLFAANWFLMRRHREMGEEQRFFRRIVMLVLTVLGIILVLLLIPVPKHERPNLVTLVGVIITGAIALASTTFVAHAMAGLMLRTVRSFRPGDFVRVGEYFGRVTGRGLFHTEIQTEDRDLITLPNSYLVSQPVRVVRHSGTIVSASVSLGYDLPHQQIRSLLEQAAREAGLTEPFVQVRELGDFAITYRVAGFLGEVKQLLTAGAKLRMLVLDTLHDADVEIVSPTVMIQRRLDAEDRILPPKSAGKAVPVKASEDPVPEELIFDKADEAGRIEGLHIERAQLKQEITDLEAQLEQADPSERSHLECEIELRKTQAEDVVKRLEDEGK
jgi:small-conductance mechanosensitive channel